MSAQQIDAPLALHKEIVLPEWIDYNEHLNEGYYAVAFGNATDTFMDFVGLHAEYRDRTKNTIYTVENHISYLREVKLNAPLRFDTQVLDFDAKRIHIFHSMVHAEENFLAATMESMLFHVNDEPRSAPMPPEILTMIEAIYQAHLVLDRPPQAGKSIGIRRKKADV